MSAELNRKEVQGKILHREEVQGNILRGYRRAIVRHQAGARAYRRLDLSMK